jgi:hypothetical protein
VVAKLGITEDQLEAIHRLHEEMRPPRPPQGDERPTREQMEQMHQRMMAQREELLRKVLAVLTDEQRQTWAGMVGKPFKLSPPPKGG